VAERRYTPRGTTWDPCHACGDEGNRPKNSVCGKCRSIFERALRREAEVAAAGEDVIVRSCERAYAMPYLRHETARGDPSGENPIRKPMLRLSEVISEPAIHATDAQDLWGDGRYDWVTYRRMPRAAFEAMRDAYDAIGKALTAAHREGHREGRDLLLQLAAGEITNDEFNDRAARLDKA
jgi:hypothetical protein